MKEQAEDVETVEKERESRYQRVLCLGLFVTGLLRSNAVRRSIYGEESKAWRTRRLTRGVDSE
eukprot:263112-Hanusia_phi.AAC.4